MWAKTGAKSKIQKDSQAVQTFTKLTFKVSNSSLIACVYTEYFHTNV